MIVNDGVVGIGLFLLTIALMASYLVVVCSILVMLPGAQFSVSMDSLMMAGVVVLDFGPVAVCISTMMSVLSSGHKAVFVCFVLVGDQRMHLWTYAMYKAIDCFVVLPQNLKKCLWAV